LNIQRSNEHFRVRQISVLFYLTLLLCLMISACLDLGNTLNYDRIEEGYIYDNRANPLETDKRTVDEVRSILKYYDRKASYREVMILYPYNNSIFPPEIASPTFNWAAEGDITTWLMMATFNGRHEPLYVLCDKPNWTPSKELWGLMKENSIERPVQITVLGLNSNFPSKVVSRGTINISTSRDEVGAPFMFRRVPPSFEYASSNPESMEWCLGDISSYDEPPVIMSNMNVCASCHTFSRDGRAFGMDMDYKNNKGAYVFTDVRESVTLTDQGKRGTSLNY